MRICFDLDGTLCYGYPYTTCKPMPGAAKVLKNLKRAGHTIIIQTARGMRTACSNPGTAIKNIGKLTLEQLDEWGFEYDEVLFGKPHADLFVDDKAYHASCISQLENYIENDEAARCQASNDIEECEDKLESLAQKLDVLLDGVK